MSHLPPTHRCKTAILNALRELGGTAARPDIVALAEQRGAFSELERNTPAPPSHRSYGTYLAYNLSWAITQLRRDGDIRQRRSGCGGSPERRSAVEATAGTAAHDRHPGFRVRPGASPTHRGRPAHPRAAASSVAVTGELSRTASRTDETPQIAGLLRYRYGDSNPGFRRERAAS